MNENVPVNYDAESDHGEEIIPRRTEETNEDNPNPLFEEGKQVESNSLQKEEDFIIEPNRKMKILSSSSKETRIPNSQTNKETRTPNSQSNSIKSMRTQKSKNSRESEEENEDQKNSRNQIGSK